MFKSPLVLGVDELNSWDSYPSIKECLTSLGMNTGNILFPNGVIHALSNSKRCNFSLSESLVSQSDCIIVAAANWINEYEDYGWLANRLESIGLPAIIVGIGAQPSASPSWSNNIPEGTIRLLNYARKTSKSISVRGKVTEKTLRGLGYHDIANTGCPSMLALLEVRPLALANPSPTKPLLHSTRHGYQQQIDPVQQWFYKEAYRNKFGLLLQSETPDIYTALDRVSIEMPNEDIYDALCSVYQETDFAHISTYLRKNATVAGNLREWCAKVSGYSFCIGTRIHGTIASLLAGVPSLLVTHDDRTRELADSLSIPSVSGSEIDINKGFDYEFFAESYRLGNQPLSGFKDYAKDFRSFFIENGLMPTPSLMQL